MDIDALKKTAKAEARRAGTSHQTELNRIAARHGFTHWGALARTAADAAAEQLPPGSYMNTDFTPPRAFIPIGHAPRDGTRILAVSGSTYSAAQWRDGAWHIASGLEGEPLELGLVEPAPTHFMKADDADAERQRIAAQTPNLLRGLVEKVEGIPHLDKRALMMLGAELRLQAAESFGAWKAGAGRRPRPSLARPEGMDNRGWVESLIQRAGRVDVDPDALAEFETLLTRPDMEAIVERNRQIVAERFTR